MEIVPLLHIRDGQALVGRPGAWEPAPTPYPDGGDDLAGLARHLFARFGSVCLVDFGTGRAEEPHLNLYQKLVKQNVEVWVDAFPRTLEDVMDLFIAGADRVTVRLDQFETADLEEVLLMAEGEVWLGLPFETLQDLDRLVRKTNAERHLQEGAKGTVLIDLTAAGHDRGPDADLLTHAPEKGPTYVAGGIRDPKHVAPWKEAGADGVFVGSGLFTDLNGWANAARGEGGGEPREVGTSMADASVVVDPRRGWLPGVLPDKPGRPHLERGEDR